MKKHNFSAGPCILPQEVMQKAAQAVVELDNSGLSLIEISHRSPAFIEIMDKATSLAIELLGLQGKGYKAMFLQGGASQQFLNVAHNFLETKAGYANTGTWSTKAIKEAKLLGDVVECRLQKTQTSIIYQKDLTFLQTLIICTSQPTIPFLERSTKPCQKQMCR